VVTTAAAADEAQNADEILEVKIKVPTGLTAAPPAAELLSLVADDKPIPTANGPTSRVVTRPTLSRTLDLSVVGRSAEAPKAVAAAEPRLHKVETDAQVEVVPSAVVNSVVTTTNVSQLQHTL